jgi:(4S)-4-hydroxy-5-phosphonooxypentane-2,3-dione isomerase
METIALIVEYETHPGKEQEFLEAMQTHAQACLIEEPGCLRFEVLRPLDEQGNPIPNRFMANELFADQDALAAHRATPRWLRMAERFKVLLANRRPILCEIVR